MGFRCFILLKGKIDVYRDDDKIVSIDKIGSLFGELALEAGICKRSATLVTAEETILGTLSREDFRVYVKKQNHLEAS